MTLLSCQRRWRRLSLCLTVSVAVVAAGSSMPAWSASGDKALKDVRGVVNKLQARYQKTKDLKADFTQSTRIEGFATPLSSSGRVYIKKPGKLRWDYRDPTVEQIYVIKNQVRMYVPEHKQVLLGELTTMTASRAPLRLLQGIADLEEEFTIRPTNGSRRGAGGLPLVTLLPKPTQHESVQSMNKIVIEVQPKTYFLKTVSIHEVSGNISTFEFTNIKHDTGLQDDVFSFKVPPGVEVVQAPALRAP